MRIKFRRGPRGDNFSKKRLQRKFMKNVLEKLNCPSLRAFLQFGLGVPYSTLKNYFSEKRLIPKKVFEDMCKLANLNTDDFNVKYLDKNWGQVKGGKVKGRFKYMKTFN